MKRGTMIAISAALAVWPTGCEQRQPVPPKPDLAAEETKIRETDAAWMQKMVAKDAAGFASYYAEDAAAYAPGLPKAVGREAIQKTVGEMMKEGSLTWTTSKVVVSDAADIAYSTGTYDASLKDAKGKPAKEAGKFVTVWKRQAGGGWKVAEDIFNADGPLTPVK